MTNNHITVDGKQYTVSEETTYTMEPGKVYRDNENQVVILNVNGITCNLSRHSNGLTGQVAFPLRELISVGPKMREINVSHYWMLMDNKYSTLAAKELRWFINEALQASHLRIHNVDGSVTEWVGSREGTEPYPWATTSIPCLGLSITQIDMQDRIQLAFMRGSTVEVVE